MKSSRTCLTLACLCMALQLGGCGGGGGGPDVDMDDDGYIEISTLQQLDWMRNDLAGTSRHDGISGSSKGCPDTGCIGYELVADLDFDTNANGTADAGDTYFDYAGNGSNQGWLPVGTAAAPFTARFNGNGHTISNLYVDRTAADVGLFGYVGGLIPVHISNLTVAGAATQVTGGSGVGLIIGSGKTAQLTNVHATGVVSGTSAVGGIIGLLDHGWIHTASSDVDVSGGNAGGIAGQVKSSDDFFSIIDCTSSGTVQGTYNVGGLLGSLTDASIAANNNTVIVQNSSSTSAVVGGTGGPTGGLIGQLLGTPNLNLGIQVENTTATGTVTSTGNNVGGLIGQAEASIGIHDSSANNDVSGDLFVGGLVGHAINGVVIQQSSSSGTTTGNSAVAGLVGRIEAPGPYELFIYQSVSAGDVIVSNLYAGGIAGWVEGDVSISQSSSTSTVTGINADNVGGLIGLARFGTISIIGSHATGPVAGRDFVGGLIGSFNFINGSASGSGADEVRNSFSTSTVNGRNYVGGLIGLSYNVDHSDNFATGAVTGNDFAGGLIGDINESFNVASLAHSFSAGSVALTATPSGTNHRLGGLVGYNDGASFDGNYFATDTSGQANALGANNAAGGLNPAGTLGVTLAALQSPTAPAFADGGVDTLYVGWQPINWDFGSSSQLPGLKIAGTVLRDGNADGTLD